MIRGGRLLIRLPTRRDQFLSAAAFWHVCCCCDFCSCCWMQEPMWKALLWTVEKTTTPRPHSSWLRQQASLDKHCIFTPRKLKKEDRSFFCGREQNRPSVLHWAVWNILLYTAWLQGVKALWVRRNRMLNTAKYMFPHFHYFTLIVFTILLMRVHWDPEAILSTY